MEEKVAVTVNQKGFVVVDGVKLPCKLKNGLLEFCTKDKRIAAKRGSKFVKVDPADIEAVDKISVTQ